MWCKNRTEFLSRMRGMEGMVKMLAEDAGELLDALERIMLAAAELVQFYDDDGVLVGGALDAHRRQLVRKLALSLEAVSSSSPPAGGGDTPAG
jgi:hypothetical protein